MSARGVEREPGHLLDGAVLQVVLQVAPVMVRLTRDQGGVAVPTDRGAAERQVYPDARESP